MDVALSLGKLIPNAVYSGSLTANTEDVYNNINWQDERAKPSWDDIENAWTELEDAMAKESLATAAQTAIEKSDVTVLRCYENAVTVPSTWQEYRTTLRAIISGTSTATSLPTMPDYPEGT